MFLRGYFHYLLHSFKKKDDFLGEEVVFSNENIECLGVFYYYSCEQQLVFAVVSRGSNGVRSISKPRSLII